MHGLPCSSLGHCFGHPSDVNPDPAPPQEPNGSRRSRNAHGPAGTAGAVVSQPKALAAREHEQPHGTVSCVSTTNSTKPRDVNGSSTEQNREDEPCSESSTPRRSLSLSSEDDELECSPQLELKYPQIPRPSIIILQSKESEFQETAFDRSDSRDTEDGGLSGTDTNTRFLFSLCLFCRLLLLHTPGTDFANGKCSGSVRRRLLTEKRG
ncbi:hypothetical protein JOB18_007554 [Solea senegalensis]|uniref:Uncharacterized protein n=1 Tax=Solea senegalensis TaxID=28829 RepID=A0AAV6SXA1_SOLSE|nr:hypothetical protein JOB18_007554 [Solea senegalensis]